MRNFNWESLVHAYEKEIWEATVGESIQSTLSTSAILTVTWSHMQDHDQIKWSAKLARLQTWKNGLYQSYVCLIMFANHCSGGICSEIWELIASTLKMSCIQTHLSKENGNKIGRMNLSTYATDLIRALFEIGQNIKLQEVMQVFEEVAELERGLDYKILERISYFDGVRGKYFYSKASAQNIAFPR